MPQGVAPAPDYKEMVTMVLNMTPNGELTIPLELQEELGFVPGHKVSAVRIGQTLVLAPHDEELEAFSQRLEAAMKTAGVSLQELTDQALVERAEIIQERYGPK